MDLKTIALKFYQSGNRFTPGETSPWASLMAGDIPLGPSDVPCSGETSTAHGDLLFGANFLHSGRSKPSCFPVSSSNQALIVLPLHLHHPKRPISVQICPPSPASRHALIPRIAKASLGFPLVGPNSNVGPLSFKWSKPIRSISNPNPLKPRSDPSSPLSIFSRCTCRDYQFSGRGLHRRGNSPSLLWIYFILLKTLVLVSLMAMFYEPQCLSVYGLSFPTPCRQSFGYDNEKSKLTYHPTTSLANKLKHLSANTLQFRILCYYEVFYLLKRDLELLLCVSKQNASRSTTIVTQFLAKALLRVDLLVPARSTALASSSTSLRLLTVTIVSSIDSFVEELSTICDLTCVKSLPSICFKALMELLLIYLIYLFVVLGNALFCYVLNSGISESLSCTTWFLS